MEVRSDTGGATDDLGYHRSSVLFVFDCVANSNHMERERFCFCAKYGLFHFAGLLSCRLIFNDTGNGTNHNLKVHYQKKPLPTQVFHCLVTTSLCLGQISRRFSATTASDTSLMERIF